MNRTMIALASAALAAASLEVRAADKGAKIAKGDDKYAETASPEAKNKKLLFISKVHEPGLPLKYSTYLMKGTDAAAAPVFVMMEQNENATPPKMEMFAAEGLIPPGLVVFVMNGSLKPTVKGGFPRYMRGEAFGRSGRGFPSVLIDELIPAAAKSCGVTVSNDPDMHFIMGSSAGGHLALLAATGSRHRTYLPVDGTDALPCTVQWCVAIYPAYTIEGTYDNGTPDGSNDPALRLAPELPFDPDTPPILFVHGDADEHPATASVATWEQLRRMGVQGAVHTLATRGHCFYFAAAPGTGSYTFLDRVWEFLTDKNVL